MKLPVLIRHKTKEGDYSPSLFFALSAYLGNNRLISLIIKEVNVVRKLSYDFSSIDNVFAEGLAKGSLTSSQLRTIQRELNLFFKDSRCIDVYYTDNTSKPFFGMIVCPRIYADRIYDYLMGDDSVRFNEYTIEIDSHLFNPLLKLRSREITAILLHEVGHVVNDATPIMDARKYLDEYLAKNNESMKMTDSAHYKEILAYALKDFVSKDRSIFYTNNVDEILADDFVRSYNYGAALEAAMQKILSGNAKLYQGQIDDKFTTFMWSLQLYKNIQYRRIPALRMLNKAKALTGSRIEKAELENVIRRINRMDDNTFNEAKDFSLISKIKNRMKKMRIDTMKSLDDDYYEINMRIRNVEDEDDALYLMRQLNTRVSLISDFIESEDMSSSDRKKWQDSLDRFNRLRQELSDTVVYKNKSYGIFVSYPDIQDNRY